MVQLPKFSRKTEILLDFCLVFLYTAILIRPYFRAVYEDKWQSIESTFISDARYLAENWPHPQWQPLWYTGTRFDYIYPPALRYGTAAVIKLFGFVPARAYHFYVALFYALGIAGVYLLMRVGTNSRAAAWLGAVATSLMSPIFLFMPRFRDDAWMLQPQRLGVLVKYGEGPHMSALALIPIALAFSWLALEKRRPWAMALASLAGAGVVATNFYGAVALATFYPLLVWSLWITRLEKRILVPAFAIPVFTYGLCAFWLVPSYFRITLRNMIYVSQHGSVWSIWLAVGVVVAFGLASDWLARRKPGRAWSVFVTGCVVFFSLNVLGNYYFNFRIAGEPIRLLPELDMIYIMAAVLALQWMWDRPGIALRGVAIAVVLMALYSAKGYVRHAWHVFPATPDYQSRVEYRIPDWLWHNLPDARVESSGSVRFWFDAWHDLAELGGGSDQGLLNRQVEPAQWEANLGRQGEPTELWMQSMAVDALFVSDRRSQEFYKDFEHPEKVAGLLSVIFDDGQGDRIYRVPRRYPARARVVDTAQFQSLKPQRANDDVERLGAYVDAIEKGPDSVPSLTREGPDAMLVHAKVEPGQSILVQEAYDPAWQAVEGSRLLPIHKDVMGFMWIDAPPGNGEIRLEFRMPLENTVGRIITLAAFLILLSMAIFERFWEPLV